MPCSAHWPPPRPHTLTLAQPTGGQALRDSHWAQSSWAQRALQEISSFQAGGMFVPPVSMSSSPPPLVPGQAITCLLADRPLHCARLCLSPSSCGQSSGPALCSPPGPCLLHPCPLCALPVLTGGWDKFQELGSRSAHACSPGPALPQERPRQADQPLNPGFDTWSS